MEFRAGTEVAVRGLAVGDDMSIINYDFPSFTEDYVYRIERARGKENTDTKIVFLKAAPKTICVQSYYYCRWEIILH